MQELLAEITLDLADANMPKPEEFENETMLLISRFVMGTKPEQGEKIVVQVYLEDNRPQPVKMCLN